LPFGYAQGLEPVERRRAVFLFAWRAEGLWQAEALHRKWKYFSCKWLNGYHLLSHAGNGGASAAAFARIASLLTGKPP